MKFEDLANSSGAVQNLANAIKDFQAMVFQLLTDLPQSPRPFTIGDVRPNESIVEAPVSGIRKVRVYNTDPSKIVYLGTSSVNADTGYPLAPGGSQQFVLIPGQPSLYGITAGGTAELRVWEM